MNISPRPKAENEFALLRYRGRAECPERLRRPDSTSIIRLAMTAHVSQSPAMCPELGEIDVLLTDDTAGSNERTQIDSLASVWLASCDSRR